MSGSHSSTCASTRRIVIAAAAVASSTGLMAGQVSAKVPAQGPTLSNSRVHETLWGGHSRHLWEKESKEKAYPVDSSSTINIPRGGTDEAMSSKSASSKTSSGNTYKKEDSEEGDVSTADKQVHDVDDNDASTSAKTNKDNPMVEEILKSKDYYDVLGLPRGEDDIARIKKAYRRRAVQTHPDKTGGDRRAFDKLAEAYDVLLDDDKRALYDLYGKGGLDPSSAGQEASSAGDLFRSFFGQQPPQQQGGGRPNQTLLYQYAVSLEDLYQGVTRKVSVEAPTQQHMHGFMYQEPSPPKKKQVEVPIPRGSFGGQHIRLSGEMDLYSDEAPPGDLVFQLQLQPHKTFTRKGHDLAMTVTISLSEAIRGCTRTVRHLNGRAITIESAKRFSPTATMMPPPDTNIPKLNDLEDITASDDQVTNMYIQTGDVQVLKGKGMPKDQHGNDYGDLYVIYKVELPKAHPSMEHLTPSERMELARLLEKLEGKKNSNNSMQKRSKKSPLNKLKHKPSSHTHVLELAILSDFGLASGIPNFHEQDHLDDEDHHGQQQHHFPFSGMGMGHRQFFYSSTGQSPFFGQETNFEDDGNVQCSQM